MDDEERSELVSAVVDVSIDLEGPQTPPLGLDIGADSTVTAIASNSPALGQLQLGDAIVSVDGQPVADRRHLDALLAVAAAHVRLGVRRDVSFSADEDQDDAVHWQADDFESSYVAETSVVERSETWSMSAASEVRSERSAVSSLKGRKGFVYKCVELRRVDNEGSTDGMKLRLLDGRVIVRAVPRNLLAEGKLCADDAIIAVDGKRATGVDEVLARIGSLLRNIGVAPLTIERRLPPKDDASTPPPPPPPPPAGKKATKKPAAKEPRDNYTTPRDLLGVIERHRALLRQTPPDAPRSILQQPTTKTKGDRTWKLLRRFGIQRVKGRLILPEPAITRTFDFEVVQDETKPLRSVKQRGRRASDNEPSERSNRSRSLAKQRQLPTSESKPGRRAATPIPTSSRRSRKSAPTTSQRPSTSKQAKSPCNRRPSSTAATSPTARRPISTAATSPTARRPISTAAKSPTPRRPSLTAATSPTPRRPISTAAQSPTPRRPSMTAAQSPTQRRRSSQPATSPSPRCQR